MTLKTGLNTKIGALLILVTFIFCLGGFIFLREYNQTTVLNKRQNLLFNNILQLEYLQRTLLDTNLNAMDIIVDRNEHAEFKFKINEERIVKFNSLKKDFSELKPNIITISQNFSHEKELENLIINSSNLFAGVEKLINTINSKTADSKIFAEIDNIIDTATVNSAKEVDKIRNSLVEENNKITYNLDSNLYNLAKTFLIVFGLTLGTLVFVVFPVILLYVTRDLKKIRNQLNSTTLEIKNNSDVLSDVSYKMSESSNQTSSAIHSSVSSMAEITSMLAQTSKNTAATALTVKEMHLCSQNGSQIMTQLSASMNKISNANNHLQDITKIIDDINGKTNIINDIVFKTQLLAVNASIEAARAGHHGKGFSVVANEVSNLATLSGKAAEEIKELLKVSSSRVSDIISSTSETVKSGEYVCKHAVENFTTIANSINEITEKLGTIEEASKEQEIGVQQTSAALNQMNRETLKNNHLAGENSNLSENLKTQVKKLVAIQSALNFVLNGKENTNKKQRKMFLSEVEKILLQEQQDMINHSKSPNKNTEEDSTLLSTKKKLASSLIEKFNQKMTADYNKKDELINLNLVEKNNDESITEDKEIKINAPMPDPIKKENGL